MLSLVPRSVRFGDSREELRLRYYNLSGIRGTCLITNLRVGSSHQSFTRLLYDGIDTREACSMSTNMLRMRGFDLDAYWKMTNMGPLNPYSSRRNPASLTLDWRISAPTLLIEKADEYCNREVAKEHPAQGLKNLSEVVGAWQLQLEANILSITLDRNHSRELTEEESSAFTESWLGLSDGRLPRLRLGCSQYQWTAEDWGANFEGEVPTRDSPARNS